MRQVLIAVGLAALITVTAAAQDDASRPACYTTKVLPILKQHCYRRQVPQPTAAD